MKFKTDLAKIDALIKETDRIQDFVLAHPNHPEASVYNGRIFENYNHCLEALRDERLRIAREYDALKKSDPNSPQLVELSEQSNQLRSIYSRIEDKQASFLVKALPNVSREMSKSQKTALLKTAPKAPTREPTLLDMLPNTPKTDPEMGQKIKDVRTRGWFLATRNMSVEDKVKLTHAMKHELKSSQQVTVNPMAEQIRAVREKGWFLATKDMSARQKSDLIQAIKIEERKEERSLLTNTTPRKIK